MAAGMTPGQQQRGKHSQRSQKQANEAAAVNELQSRVMQSLLTLMCRLRVDCTPKPQAELQGTAEVSPERT